MALSVTLLPLLQAFVLESHKAEVPQVSLLLWFFIFHMLVMPQNHCCEYSAQADCIELLSRPVNNSCKFCRCKGLQCIIILMDPKN